MGDPAGVGGEIALKAWAALRGTGPAFALIDDPARVRRLAERPGAETVKVVVIDDLDQARLHFDKGVPVLPLGFSVDTGPGAPDDAGALAAIASLEAATAAALSGDAAGLVTLPIHKKGAYDNAFPYAGQTEFLADACGAAHAVMMIAGPSLKTVPVTVHQPLREAIETLDADLIARTGRITAEALKRDFGIAAPRLALCGLNPHAGENGALGEEDGAIVALGVAKLRALGIDARGPLPADTLFHGQAREAYDAVLGMYHDQALIPVKTLHFHEAVNVTLGLPIVRTSPDHGTAFDIAGTGEAAAGSLIAAIRMAGAIVEKRARRTAARASAAR